ncbi:hypothetical protein Tco_0097778 [Tanacetum coccineum]
MVMTMMVKMVLVVTAGGGGGDDGVGCGGTAAGEEGEGKSASGASGVDGRVDRVTRKLFEAHRNLRERDESIIYIGESESRGGGYGVGWHGKRRGGGDSRVLARGRAVWESEYGDTVGRSGRRRETLLFSAVNARRKTFSAAADMWWPEVVVARQNMTSRMAAVGGGP